MAFFPEVARGDIYLELLAGTGYRGLKRSEFRFDMNFPVGRDYEPGTERNE
jgi:hypothetical protein